jgi:glycosyltransferase involved in cell wall biosynthesis
MRILWLPHLHWDFIRQGQREYRFAQAIKDAHDVQFVTWTEVRTNRRAALTSLQARTWEEDGLTIHRARRVPNFLGQRVHERSARGLRVNEWLHSRTVRDVVRRERIDLVICAISHQSVGLPPADLEVPLVFDYLDYKLERWPELEAEYMARADAVLCTSHVLVDRAARLHPKVYYLPNGVDVDAMRRADGSRVRRRLGLERSKVVSLIGVTASDRPFYVDAVAAVAHDAPEVAFLLVGDPGELGKTIAARAHDRGVRLVSTGRIPPAEVADYFAASDVGLYPGEKSAYFDAACPLKVLEYTAARKPVVATDLTELRNWGFPNVRLAPPTADAFAGEIKAALAESHDFPDLDEFRWSKLSDRLDEILGEVAARGKR